MAQRASATLFSRRTQADKSEVCVSAQTFSARAPATSSYMVERLLVLRKEFVTAILNQTTKVTSEQTIAEIIALLARHGAVSVTQSNRDRAVATISFVLKIRDVNVSFRLPVNEAGVESYLLEETLARIPLIRRHVSMFSSERRAAIQAQARRTAWRIQKDWITAQLALVASRQAELDEVFLPYAVADNGQTLYEAFLAKNRLQLAGGTVPIG